MIHRHRLLTRPLVAFLFALVLLGPGGCNRSEPEPPRAVVTPLLRPELTPIFDDLERRTFDYFWETAVPETGLIPDRYPYTEPFSSIAAIGFGLTAYGIGAERGFITREQAVERTLITLRFLEGAPQGSRSEGMTGYHGFFYHFLDLGTGARYADWVELSSVDTALLLGGVLFAQSYFDRETAGEGEIRRLADTIYRRVEWPWMQVRPPLISMGWYPKQGYLQYDWQGYNEGMLIYVLALGSPTQGIGADAWSAWTKTYERAWGTFQQQEYLGFAPLFGHQYSHVWIDYRGIQDAYMRERGFDYFENSRRATYAQRSYAIANPMGWKLYGENVWGLTASDGPSATSQDYGGKSRAFRHYSARGAGLADAFDDGTIAPTAAAASLPFAPEIVIPAVEELHAKFGEQIYSKYGFLDAFNPSFTYDVPLKTGHLIPGFGWVASDYIGIDQGPILAMIQNYRDDFVWKVMRKNQYIRRGLQRAGFKGGWLDETPAPAVTTAAK
ncbi:MAG: glucoamylase family protein [Rhodanobacteraceae bacterium]